MKKRKHIVIVTPYYAPAWAYGGPPRVLSTLAQALVKMGVEVSVITTDSLGDTRTPVLQETLDGVSVHRYSTLSNQLCYSLKIFFIPGLLSQSASILQRADYVLFSDVRALLSWQLFPFLAKKNIPYGVFLFGQIEYGEGIKKWIKYLFDRIWVRSYIKNASTIFAQTQHERQLAISFLHADPAKTVFSLLPIPVISTPKKTQSESFRSRYSIPLRATVLLFVGRLHWLKGVDILVSSLIPLLQKKKLVYLCIVGRNDGVEEDLKAMIPKTLQQRIIFTGPLYDKDTQEAYAGSDVFVFTPRFFEETSTAALEALATGMPVITTVEADIPFLEEYGAGFVIENTSKEIERASREIISKIQQDSHFFEKKTKKLITDHYLVSVVANKLLQDIGIRAV